MRLVSVSRPTDLASDVAETSSVSLWGPTFFNKRNQMVFEIGPCLITYFYYPEQRKCISNTEDIDTHQAVSTRVFRDVDPETWSDIVNKF